VIGTASTSYNEPYNIARRFATLDHVSGGRAGWNIVTTADLPSARNFGREAVPEHAQRYRRASEFTEVVKALWDSWDDDAFVGDKAAGRFVDTDKVHPIHHQGEFYAVQGALNLPRSPQGPPVLVQAGGSADGRELAARHAEAVFTLAVVRGIAGLRASSKPRRGPGRGATPSRCWRADHHHRQHRGRGAAPARRTGRS
jgi:alkanesulfonate monooxygenase SsuD/methylene tetrahydromethanopterin reductase-like flavin-dependent oxidoreductase (luciferase family)